MYLRFGISFKILRFEVVLRREVQVIFTLGSLNWMKTLSFWNIFMMGSVYYQVFSFAHGGLNIPLVFLKDLYKCVWSLLFCSPVIKY